MSRAWYITHPDVVLDAERPVARWPLSERGLSRMRRALELPWVRELTHVFSSDEQKALDGAEVLVEATGARHSVLPGLGENDRTATGFIPPAEFGPVVDRFFAEPEASVRGWERAIDAQSRVVAAVREGVSRAAAEDRVAFVAHGGVGALLLAAIRGAPISRSLEQPGPPPGLPAGCGGGYYFTFEPGSLELVHGWRPIDGEEPT